MSVAPRLELLPAPGPAPDTCVTFIVSVYNEAATIATQICLRKLRIYEVPIAYYGRTYDEGKKITWRDGFKALRVLVVWRLRGATS
jgi:hypothetical protein